MTSSVILFVLPKHPSRQVADNSGNISQCTGFAFKATFTLLFFQNVNKHKHVKETIGGTVSTPLEIFLCVICNEDCSSCQ
jgi:hypothetical protein